MKVFISSYAAYAAARLVGEWYDITDYANAGELQDAARLYLTAHGIDADELMYQDWEGVPDLLTDEAAPRWADIFEWAERPEDERDIIAAYIDHVGTYDPDEALEAHIGEAEFSDDYRQTLIDLWFEVTEVPDHLAGYIDKDLIFADMDLDHFHAGGHVFRNM